MSYATFTSDFIAWLQTQLSGATIYAGLAPANAALPYVAYHPIGNDSDYCHDGENIPTAVLQFDIDAATPTACAALFDALNTALSGHSGTYNATRIFSVFRQPGTFEQPIDAILNGTLAHHRLSVTYDISYSN